MSNDNRKQIRLCWVNENYNNKREKKMNQPNLEDFKKTFERILPHFGCRKDGELMEVGDYSHYLTSTISGEYENDTVTFWLNPTKTESLEALVWNDLTLISHILIQFYAKILEVLLKGSAYNNVGILKFRMENLSDRELKIFRGILKNLDFYPNYNVDANEKWTVTVPTVPVNKLQIKKLEKYIDSIAEDFRKVLLEEGVKNPIIENYINMRMGIRPEGA